MPVTQEQALDEIRESEIALLDSTHAVRFAVWCIWEARSHIAAMSSLGFNNTGGAVAVDEINRAIGRLKEVVGPLKKFGRSEGEQIEDSLAFLTVAANAFRQPGFLPPDILHAAESELGKALKELEKVPIYGLQVFFKKPDLDLDPETEQYQKLEEDDIATLRKSGKRLKSVPRCKLVRRRFE